MKKLNFILGLFILVCLNQSIAQNKRVKYQITNKIHLDGNEGWDYLTMDDLASRLYISHGSMVQVLNTKTRTVAGVIPDTKGVHGIALARELNKGFISNGKDTSVTIFEIKTLQFITKIKITGLNPDAVLYDPFSKRVFVFNGKTSNATVIDAKSNKIIGTIKLPGKPEFSVTDLKGKIYVNIEDKNGICIINVNTLKVEQMWPINPGEGPSGLAIDIESHRLFTVCDNKLMIVINSGNGKVVTTLKIGENVDGVAFDSILKRIFASNGDGSLTIVQEESKNIFRILGNLPTQKGARTIALNPRTHKIYLPTAEFSEASAPTTEHPHPRPSMRPNTFTILEISAF
jgi:DNA-binding beta-propeller fold protein YncE